MRGERSDSVGKDLMICLETERCGWHGAPFLLYIKGRQRKRGHAIPIKRGWKRGMDLDEATKLPDFSKNPKKIQILS